MHPGPFDLAVILVFLAAFLAAGIWIRPFVRGIDDFTLAGRKAKLNLGLASLAVTDFGPVTLVFAQQLGFTKGLAGASVGMLLGAVLYIVGRTGFIVGPLRRAGVTTLPEFLERRFGNKVRLFAGLLLVVGSILTMAAGARCGAEFLAAGFGLASDWVPWIIAGLVSLALLYTFPGGMMSVLAIHFIQSIVLTAGLVVVSVVVISHFGWNRLVTHLWLCWDGTLAGAGQTLHSHPFNPFHSSSFGAARLAGQLLLQIVLATVWQPALSRLLSTHDEKVARQTRSHYS